MKLSKSLMASALLMTAATLTQAAETNTYQVTGPVIAVTPTSITVQKDKEKWEIARDASTSVKGDPKVGTKVTIKYRMSATHIEVKDK
jgi:hypothetical protein